MPVIPGASYPRQVQATEVEAAFGRLDELVPIGDQSGSGECWYTRSGGDRLVVKVVVNEHDPGRFAREVEALGRLSSRRLMCVHDHGTIPSTAGTYPYLRSEFVDGGNLRGHLAGNPSPPDGDIRAFLPELLRALQELSDAKIVHRDLKPENIILRSGQWGEPVIIDLGLSRLMDAATLTVYPWAKGTWPYMAPEQLKGERATDRSDVWAAAVMAGELAAGQHPFHRGERSMPADWDARLRGGVSVPGSRPAALRDWIVRGSDYRAYRRPSAERSADELETAW